MKGEEAADQEAEEKFLLAQELLPLDADALVLVALSSYHHVCLIQNKHLDLLGVNELELGAPVQNGPRGANDNVLTDLLTPSGGVVAFPPSGTPAVLHGWSDSGHSPLHVSLVGWESLTSSHSAPTGGFV